MGLICFSLITDANVFSSIYQPSGVSFGKMSVQILCSVLIRLFGFLLLNFVSLYIFKTLTSCQLYKLQTFSPILEFFLMFFFPCKEDFQFDVVPFNFALMLVLFAVISRNYCQDRCQESSTLCSLLIILQFKSLILS